jgi:hypothetical protein
MRDKQKGKYRLWYIVGQGEPEYESLTRDEALKLLAFKHPIRQNSSRAIRTFLDKGNKFNGLAMKEGHYEALQKVAAGWKALIDCERKQLEQDG